jgi:hypothetical protein
MANRHFLSDYFKNKTQSFKVKDSKTLKILKQYGRNKFYRKRTIFTKIKI